MQDSDIEELIDLHGNYSAKLAFSYHISKYSASSFGSLVDREPVVPYQVKMCMFLRGLGKSISHWY